MCVATNLTHSRRSWVIHVIPAISTCPVHPRERTQCRRFVRMLRSVIGGPSGCCRSLDHLVGV